MNIINSIKDIVRRITGEVPTKTLVKRGLKVGDNFNRQQGCFIDPTHCFLIEIGNNVTMSIRVVLLAHDASMKKHIGYTKIGKIRIGNNVFIGANSIVLPNVTIGDNCIIGSNCVVTKSIPANSVAVGNPARVICTVEEFKDKHETMLQNCEAVFDETYVMNNGLNEEKKAEMLEKISDKNGYIV